MRAKNFAAAAILFFTPLAGFAAPQLTKLWELDGLKNPESVVYDAQRGVLYVSNVNGAPPEKDGNGFISRVSPDGKLLDESWVSGMNAPKGLALHGDKLYTADIDTLVEIDVAHGKVLHRYAAPQAKFLNDVTIDRQGRVYVSDMLDNTIYRLADGRFELWLKDEALESPNGLYAEHDRIVEGAWGAMTGEGFNTKTPGHLKTIALRDKKISSLGGGKPIGNLDGVAANGRGAYFVTDWVAGKLFHVSPTGDTELLLEPGQGSADLSYVKDKKLLLVPMMSTNQLLAFRVN